MVAIKPIPMTTIQTNDSIIEIPLLDLAIYFYPFIFILTIFQNFNILKAVKCNHISIIMIRTIFTCAFSGI